MGFFAVKLPFKMSEEGDFFTITLNNMIQLLFFNDTIIF